MLKAHGQLAERAHTVYVRSWAASEEQSVHKDLVDDWWRGHQVLQLEVEYALQALSAQGPKLRQLAQEARQAARWMGLSRHSCNVLLQAAGDAVLQLLHPPWLLQSMPLCDEDKC